MVESHEGEGDSTGLAMTAVRQRPQNTGRPDTTLSRHSMPRIDRRRAAADHTRHVALTVALVCAGRQSVPRAVV